MDEEARRLEDWLSKGYHGEMGYMANHFEMRTDPTKLVPGAKSVISLMYNYYPKAKAEAEAKDNEESPPPFLERRSSAEALKGVGGFITESHSQLTTHNSPFKISKYAYGEDYHQIVRRKLKALLHEMKTEFGDFHGRVFVDSAPVMERDWAKRSGMGWIGRNTLLIDPKRGSYFFLAEIILDVEFEYDHPIRDHCGDVHTMH
jgi:epoxyqueuosine reductase